MIVIHFTTSFQAPTSSAPFLADSTRHVRTEDVTYRVALELLAVLPRRPADLQRTGSARGMPTRVQLLCSTPWRKPRSSPPELGRDIGAVAQAAVEPAGCEPVLVGAFGSRHRSPATEPACRSRPAASDAFKARHWRGCRRHGARGGCGLPCRPEEGELPPTGCSAAAERVDLHRSTVTRLSSRPAFERPAIVVSFRNGPDEGSDNDKEEAMSSTTKHPSSEHHHSAAAAHEAAAHHHRQAAHHHNTGKHEDAKQHAVAAHEHSTTAHGHTGKAHEHSHK